MLIDYILVWWTVPQLVKWLNEWTKIQKIMEKIGPTECFDIRRFRDNFGVGYISIPTFVVGAGVLYINKNGDYLIFSCLQFSYAIITMLCFGTEDLKSMLMMVTISSSFKQVQFFLIY